MVTATKQVGIVHDWFPGPTIAGGERVVQQMVRSFPNCAVYGIFDFLNEDQRQELVEDRSIITSRLNNLPLANRYYRHLLLASIRAVEAFDLSEHEVVLSSSAALAKGVITSPEQLHVAYVHSPARYAWDLTHEYIQSLQGPLGPVKRLIAREMMHRFRMWDMRTPQSIDVIVANSKFIKSRIRKVYGRDAEVIYPPVNTDDFTPGVGSREEFYLAASRLVPYKRIDLIVEAFTAMPDKKLVVIGDGPEMTSIKKIAGRNIEILGHQPFGALLDHMRRAKAFIFGAKEDFGIMPVEAQACGTPVIALGYAGTAETIQGLDRENPTGVHFLNQSVKDLINAVNVFERNQDKIHPENCRKNALSFRSSRFNAEIRELVSRHR